MLKYTTMIIENAEIQAFVRRHVDVKTLLAEPRKSNMGNTLVNITLEDAETAIQNNSLTDRVGITNPGESELFVYSLAERMIRNKINFLASSISDPFWERFDKFPLMRQLPRVVRYSHARNVRALERIRSQMQTTIEMWSIDPIFADTVKTSIHDLSARASFSHQKMKRLNPDLTETWANDWRDEISRQRNSDNNQSPL